MVKPISFHSSRRKIIECLGMATALATSATVWTPKAVAQSLPLSALGLILQIDLDTRWIPVAGWV